ncbi:hypothetical protein GCM10009119_42540 [Algoriphagus jejuensis]|uniref:Uncharacterized protein n=2 Tax=Algoriphagus jejuensis TaxID=419934 RepID=A0ABN1N5P7_9BACT
MTNAFKQKSAFFGFLVLVLFGCEMDQVQNLDQAKLQETELRELDLTDLPDGYESRLNPQVMPGAANRQQVIGQQTDTYYREMVRRAVGAVEPTECGTTNLDYWLDEQLADWDGSVFNFAIFSGMLDFPTYDALLFENSSQGQYFGKNGEYSQRMAKTFKDLKRFWNIQSDKMVLAAMHGNMLQDRDKLIRIDQILYGDDLATAEFWADLILEYMAAYPQYQNGEHPIFTLNAFAQSSFFFPPVGIIPDKIVMGDGILEAYKGLGFDDVAPQAILAHEFGHQIQFQLDLFDPISSPEGTRRTELMADAYSAYYLSHARGATMQWKRVKLFLEVFFNIGDCGFTSNGHHGTPLQRMAAAEWGYNVANKAKKQGHILSPLEFAAMFDTKLPELVAP